MELALVSALFADSELPNPGRDSFIGTAAIVGSILGAAWELVHGRSWGAIERSAVKGGLLGAAIGLIAYVGTLLGSVL